ncbi:MAG: hypothetical protein WA750_04045, partial [Pseudolabrys sp.]
TQISLRIAQRDARHLRGGNAHRFRLCRASSEVLNNSHGDLANGAVKEKDVETGRKGQRGQ